MPRAAIAVCLVLAGCDGAPTQPDAGRDSGNPQADAGPDAQTPPDGGPPEDCEGPPGLYIPGSCTILAEGVRPYRPRFVLWSDSADKERYIYLPPGEQIDTTQADDWVFPRGTRIYKTFLHDGLRLETRVLTKTGLGTGTSVWEMRTYAWNSEQDGVRDVTGILNDDDPARRNVLGTTHDIPSGAQCLDCHSGTLDTVNSFSAIQLNHGEGGVTLQTLRDEGLLTNDIDPAMAMIPGAPADVAALGYLHANCGNCHRTTTGDDPCRGTALQRSACLSGLHMWVRTGLATADATDTVQTAVGVRSRYFVAGSPCRIHPGQPDASTVLYRMSQRGGSAQMPPIGTEYTHPEGNDLVRAWISGLTGDASECVEP